MNKTIPTYDAQDLEYEGLTMIVIRPEGTNGDFTLLEYGKGFVPTTLGVIMVIPEKYIFQLHKCKLFMKEGWNPQLILKDGESFEELNENESHDRVNELKNTIIDMRKESQSNEEASAYGFMEK